MSRGVLLRTISKKAYVAALARTELVDALLFTGFPEWVLAVPAADDQSPAAIIQRSRAHDARRDIARIEALVSECRLGSDDMGAACELDEGWAFLVHPCESGDAIADAFVAGAEPIGDDRGYGPASVFSPDAVAKLNSDLRTVDLAHVESVFDTQGLEASLDTLRRFVAVAHERGAALVGSMA